MEPSQEPLNPPQATLAATGDPAGQPEAMASQQELHAAPAQGDQQA